VRNTWPNEEPAHLVTCACLYTAASTQQASSLYDGQSTDLRLCSPGMLVGKQGEGSQPASQLSAEVDACMKVQSQAVQAIPLNLIMNIMSCRVAKHILHIFIIRIGHQPCKPRTHTGTARQCAQHAPQMPMFS
jgi:hypothetical protein